MGATVQANDGAMLPLDSLAQEFEYDGTFIASISVNYAGVQYVQTFTNDGVNIIYISGWESVNVEPAGQPMYTEGGDIMLTEDGQIMITE